MLFFCFSYDENAALLRRRTHSRIHVRPALRSKLNRALAQIIRNKDLEGNSTLEPQHVKSDAKEEQTGEKKSHDISSQQHSEQDEMNSGSGESFSNLNEIT